MRRTLNAVQLLAIIILIEYCAYKIAEQLGA